MGFIEFIVLCIIVLVIAWVGVLVLGKLVPGHPPIVDTLIWGVAILIIIVALLRAIGIMNHDPQIPRL